MVTYAQLQSEPWWAREIVPQPLKDLGVRLCTYYGRPLTAYGTKGDNLHLNGAHRSQEWIKNSQFCTNRTYTVQSGLTSTQERYIAGFDFNPGSTQRMITLCGRLDRAVRTGTLEVVLAWYGNLDGDTRVDGYDNVRNRAATSDSSHLWHFHLTLDRRLVNNSAAIQKVGDVLLEGGADDMLGLKKGDQGEDVKALQLMIDACKVKGARFTTDAGKTNTLDGIYGDFTAEAMRLVRASVGSSAKPGYGDAVTAYAFQQLFVAFARAQGGGSGVSTEELKALVETYLQANKEQFRGLPGQDGRDGTDGKTPTEFQITQTAIVTKYAA